MRFSLACLAALLLAGCGFHLRDALVLPPDLGPVRVVAADPYSSLAQSLADALERAGAVAPASPREEAATLRVSSERWASTPIAIDQFGRAQEYSLRYAVVFELQRADGTALIPSQAVELSRDYVSSPTNLIGSESERDILASELRREMSGAILRRIDSALHAVSTGGTPAAQAGQDSPAAPEALEAPPGQDVLEAQDATTP